MTTFEIQRALIKAGFLAAGGDDGRLGPATTKAIKAFQVARGLSPDGKVGQLTEAALFPQIAPVRTDALPEFKPSPKSIPRGGPWPLQRDCMSFYGGVGLHQASLPLPFPMRLAWDKGVVVRKISLHQKVIESAGRAFERIALAYPDEAARKRLGIDLFGGSINVRPMRGGSSYSMHSWGIAIDFDPERNQLKWGRDRARLAQPDAIRFWEAWEAEGWVSLGRAANRDFMHVQAARLA